MLHGVSSGRNLTACKFIYIYIYINKGFQGMQKSLSPKKGVSGCAGYPMASHLTCKMCLEALVWGWVKVPEMLRVHV